MEMTKKELINAKSGSTALKDCIGKQIDIVAIATGKIIDNDGKEQNGTYLKDVNGVFYCTISNTVHKIMDDIADIITDEGKASVVVHTNKNRSGDRDYLYLQIV